MLYMYLGGDIVALPQSVTHIAQDSSASKPDASWFDVLLVQSDYPQSGVTAGRTSEN